MTCQPHNIDGEVPSKKCSVTPQRRVAEGEASALKPGLRRKVLVLDDDDAFRSFLTRMLDQQGFEVIAVANGVDGVRQILAHDFDAILCDILMPTLPGDMFYRAVERMRPHLCRRFVFITGQYEQAKVKAFIAHTGGTILLKPFQIDDLREMMAFVELRNLHLAN
jgi:two-component system cell cycle sensor histidine kinase/response regulator CckA